MDKIHSLIKEEEIRQQTTLMLIPSENYTYPEVRQAVGSVLMHKYSEGYPGKRYYQGQEVIDKIETIAIQRAKEVFAVPHANVQAYSGSPANSAVLFSLAEVGDTIMGLSLASGGHLTHGHPKITFSGKYFNSVQFGVNEKGEIDYEEVARLAKKSKPKVMLIGVTAYPKKLNWKRLGEIADSVGAWFVADISHIAGLVVGGVYPSPVRYAHVITTTTHKTLRGPRGALIMATRKGIKKDTELGTLLDRAVFPGLQGGPHDNTTAGIAIALKKAQSTSFQKYAAQVVENAKTLSHELKKGGLSLVSGGTESHLLLIDLSPLNLSGALIAEALDAAGIVVNKNAVPNDPNPPMYPSGIRLGTPAVTARGMKKRQMEKIALLILNIVDHLKEKQLPNDKEERLLFIKEFRSDILVDSLIKETRLGVTELCKKFPIE